MKKTRISGLAIAKNNVPNFFFAKLEPFCKATFHIKYLLAAFRGQYVNQLLQLFLGTKT